MARLDCGFLDTENMSAYGSLIQHGPTVQVNVGFDAQYNPDNNTTPSLAENTILALVDTGASESSIDAELAENLQLPKVDKTTISTASGVATVDLHLGHIYIPALSWTIYGKFAGVNLAAGGQHHLILLGRDFLQRMTMIYDGPTGAVTILT
ncbi:MAG: retropepsin-like aspartic protease [Parvibaculales bacterium]